MFDEQPLTEASETSQETPRRRGTVVPAALVVLLLVGLGAFIWHEHTNRWLLVESMARQNAISYAKAITEMRTIYSAEIVPIAERAGIEVRHDYRKHPGKAIPLPATLTHELGRRLSHEGLDEVSLYSPYPFPFTQGGGLRDQFARDAWSFLREHPDGELARFETINGSRVFRYAIADRMRGSCISCHNTHDLSPKTDWKVGDVRGVLEVSLPVDAAELHSDQTVVIMSSYLGGLLVMGLAAFLLVVWQQRRSSLELKDRVARRTEALSRATQALAWERDQVSTYLSTAQVGLFALDPAGLVTMMNPQSCGELGFASEAQAVGADFVEQCVSEDARKGFREWLGAVLDRTDKTTADLEAEIRRLDGIPRCLALRGAVLRDSRGEVLGVLVSGVDITERRRLEQLKDQLVSSVSHELRTPLASIHGAVKLVQGGAAGPVSSRVQNLLEIATRNTERLIRLISNFLDLRKLEAGKLVSEKRVLDLWEEINHAVRDCEILACERNVEVVISACGTTPIWGDSDSLYRVLVNLLSNALTHSPSGSTVTVRGTLGADWARVSIEDQGTGVPEEFRSQLFTAFAQHTRSTDTRKTGGTGLGLSIAKAIIDDHQGRIGFEPRAGGGATFYFELPLAIPEAVTPPAPARTHG